MSRHMNWLNEAIQSVLVVETRGNWMRSSEFFNLAEDEYKPPYEKLRCRQSVLPISRIWNIWWNTFFHLRTFVSYMMSSITEIKTCALKSFRLCHAYYGKMHIPLRFDRLEQHFRWRIGKRLLVSSHSFMQNVDVHSRSTTAIHTNASTCKWFSRLNFVWIVVDECTSAHFIHSTRKLAQRLSMWQWLWKKIQKFLFYHRAPGIVWIQFSHICVYVCTMYV